MANRIATVTDAGNGAETKVRAVGRETILVEAPDLRLLKLTIRGTTAYVQNAFPGRVLQAIKKKHEQGSQAKKEKAVKAPKNFQECYEASKHRSVDGWYGIPASAFRNALISACKMVGFAMTRAKLSLFCVGNGIDAQDATDLVRITKGEPHYAEHTVRLDGGGSLDIHARAMWDAGWEAELVIRYDAGQFSAQDVTNLIMRAGIQVGVGEGRNDSPNSAGMGWGSFEIVNT